MDKFEERLKLQEKNLEELNKEDANAKKDGKLIGRFVREHICDGYAYYKIIRENKNTVRIKVVKDIGDDWTMPMWGNEATIDKKYAVANIKQRDFFEEMFNKKRA